MGQAGAFPPRDAAVPGWCGGGRIVGISGATGVLRHGGMPAAPTRWVLVRDRLGRLDPQALLRADQACGLVHVLRWFVQRWQVEVTFRMVRGHLGVEARCQWSDPASCRLPRSRRCRLRRRCRCDLSALARAGLLRRTRAAFVLDDPAALRAAANLNQARLHAAWRTVGPARGWCLKPCNPAWVLAGAHDPGGLSGSGPARAQGVTRVTSHRRRAWQGHRRWPDGPRIVHCPGGT